MANSTSAHELWRVELAMSLETLQACHCVMFGRGGLLFVGDGNTLLAIDQFGKIVWQFTKPDGVLAIAAPPNGSVVAAGSSLLTAVSAEGNKLWETDIHTRHAIGSNESQRHPTLAVDAAGTAFVGVVDGEVAVIDSAGNAISRLDAGGYLYGDTPGVMIGLDRSLLVSGTDGVLRAYQ